MNERQRTKQERDATNAVLDALTEGGAIDVEMPISVAAGALLRASVLLAVEQYGADAPHACRQALENILNDMEPNRRLLQ